MVRLKKEDLTGLIATLSADELSQTKSASAFAVEEYPYGNGYYMSLKPDRTPIDIAIANSLAI